MLARREVSSRELLEHFLARIEKHNTALNAVVALDERALDRARAADEATARGESWGALHGVPMTVKDAIETEGLVTTSGAPMLAKHIPARDADAVACLKAAGALVFGKTNLPIFAGDLQTYNDVYGVTNNPWALDRTPGGSSGGAAAALAAGLTGFELGSDIGGSIRNPAHFSGVFGLKPTWGVVPGRGHIPGPPGSLSAADVGVLGPMGRGAADLALGLDVLAAPSPEQSIAWRLELPAPRRSSLRAYRVATWLDDPLAPVDAAVLTVLESAAASLRDAGCVVDEVAPPVSMALGMRLWEQLVFPITSGDLTPDDLERASAIAAMPPGDSPEAPRMRWARAVTISHRDWMGVDEQRLRARAAWAEFFTRYDALLAPVMPVAAFSHDNVRDGDQRTLIVNGKPFRYWDAVYWCSVFGAVHLPAASVPVGFTSDELPVGVQVVGPYLEDRTVVDLARGLEDLLGGFRPPPGY